MKKSIMIAIVAFIAIGTAFAANPASDFEYGLSNDGKYVVIYGFKNQKSTYVLPETIEDFPVKKVDVSRKSAYRIFGNAKQGTITISKTISSFELWIEEVSNTIIIDGLSENIQEFFVFSDDRAPYSGMSSEPSGKYKPILIKGIELLTRAKSVVCRNVQFDKVSLTVKKVWAPHVFSNTNLEEISFENGIKETGWHSKGCVGFAYNKKLRIVNLPSSMEVIGEGTFDSCINLKDLIIPDEISDLDFHDGYSTFRNTALPLKTQALLKQLGYNGYL